MTNEIYGANLCAGAERNDHQSKPCRKLAAVKKRKKNEERTAYQSQCTSVRARALTSCSIAFNEVAATSAGDVSHSIPFDSRAVYRFSFRRLLTCKYIWIRMSHSRLYHLALCIWIGFRVSGWCMPNQASQRAKCALNRVHKQKFLFVFICNFRRNMVENSTPTQN